MPKAIKREPTTDAVEILRRDLIGNDIHKMAEYEDAKADLAVARKIYRLRESAGLTQGQLAKLIGTSRTVISRLEDADYEGHSLAMLNRVAAALNQRVEIRFVPLTLRARKPAVGFEKKTSSRRPAAVA